MPELGPAVVDWLAALTELGQFGPSSDDRAVRRKVQALDRIGRMGSFTWLHTGAEVRAFGTSDAGGEAVRPLDDGESLPLGSTRLIALHTPGHASDHGCFYVEGAASLFAGDNVLDLDPDLLQPQTFGVRAASDGDQHLVGRHLDHGEPSCRPLRRNDTA